MASTAITTQLTFVPSPENHFGVHFGDRLDTGIRDPSAFWKNPYASSIIRPYVPSDNTDLIIKCKDTFNQHMHNPLTFDSSGAIFRALQDAFNITFIYLNPKDLVNFSEVNKCCYLATKANVVWQLQFKNLCPNTTLLPKEKCCFPPEQQFKIYFKRINDELKPYKAQFERNKVVLKNLIGPNGNDGDIAQVQKEFEELGGNAAMRSIHEKFMQAFNANADELIFFRKSNEKLTDTAGLYQVLPTQLRYLAGQGYDGTDASIDPNSQQGHCQLAITQLPGSFDNQEKFEQFIQASEVAKNNVSESNDEAIPQDALSQEETIRGNLNAIIADFRDRVSETGDAADTGTADF
jgi:hypothetical protein